VTGVQTCALPISRGATLQERTALRLREVYALKDKTL